MSEQGVAGLFRQWPQYNSRLVEAIRPLTDEQLALRAGPHHSPIWALAAHTAGGRVYWLCGVLKEPGAETTPFIDPSSGFGWEDEPEHPRTATEIVGALESSWRIVAACLERWDLPMLEQEFTRGATQRHSRQSVLLRLLTHDAFHSGEISQLLGANGIGEIDLWRGGR
ncbi:MAG TPA: DinB family protein [Candidatus Limnocylindria bacterium]|nr:DinB family protein [Candidatus Limnocylindria bacterium]